MRNGTIGVREARIEGVEETVLRIDVIAELRVSSRRSAGITISGANAMDAAEAVGAIVPSSRRADEAGAARDVAENVFLSLT